MEEGWFKYITVVSSRVVQHAPIGRSDFYDVRTQICMNFLCDRSKDIDCIIGDEAR